MLVGLTYDLKSDYIKMGFSEEDAAEFDRDETIEGIENALRELNYKTERIGNIKNLASALIAGKRWDIVFNIAEGVHGIGREAQVPALLDAWNIPYTFSDTVLCALTLHKGITKRIIRDAGVPTPDFLVVENMHDLENFKLPFPVFAKPVAEGTGKGITDKSKVDNLSDLKETCKFLLDKFKQPVLVEIFLPGRELTVAITGSGENAKVIGNMEIHYNKPETVYSYETKKNYDDYVTYSVCTDELAQSAHEVALKAWRALGCRDAGRIDIKVDNSGIPNFIEVNPLAGLDYVHSDLPIIGYRHGYTFVQIIEMIMNSAKERIL